MSESKCRLGDISLINPESLGVDTPTHYTFKYIDISSVTGGVIDWSTVRIYQFSEAPSRARRIVRQDDVLICTVRPGLQAHCYIDNSEYSDLVASTGFAVVRCGSKLNPRFLFHSLFGSDIPQQLRIKETGSNYPAVNERDIQELLLYCPDIDIQNEIARSLDTVDEAIQRTEQLIAKLKAIKQGLLHDLLTRGLDENSQISKSVPNSFIPFSGLVDIDPPQTKKIQNMDEIVSFIPMIDVSDSGIWTGNQKKLLREVYKGYTPFQESDVLFAKITPCMENGKGCHAIGLENGIGYGSTELFVLRAKHLVSPRFIYYWTLTTEFRRKAEAFMIGSAGQQRVKRAFFDNFEVPLIPFPMQGQIAEILDAQDTRIQTEQNYLEKLKLVKKGLMHDLLPGKVRVDIKTENLDQVKEGEL